MAQTHNAPPEEPFSPLIEHAIELSAQWHDCTYRKSRWRDEAFPVPPDAYLGVPVLAHLATVALTVQRAGWDASTVAAAFLHDVIEDGNRWGHRLPYKDLVEVIGHEVADLVREVSEEKLGTDGKPLPWHDRKAGYLDQLDRSTDRAVAISLADKLHNLWTMNASIEKGVDVFSSASNRRALEEGPERQLWFFSSVCDIARKRQDPRLQTMLKRLEQEISRFRSLVGIGG